MEKKRLQWHPVFFAGLQIELQDESENLIFENEHQLGTKPKEIDVLIIKKESGVPIKKNIGKIFRKYNIVEYKSPKCYLSIDDFYKALAYAYLYKADAGEQDSIDIKEITITLVSGRYPKKLIRHFETIWGYQIKEQERGIYYIGKGEEKDILPIQLIVTAKLEERENLWLRSLSNKLRSREEMEYLVKEYQKNKDNKLYESVMDIIVRVNYGEFQEVKSVMCKALEELMEDVIQAREKEAAEKAAVEATAKVTERVTEKGIRILIETCKELGLSRKDTSVRTQDKFEIKEDIAEKYMAEYWI